MASQLNPPHHSSSNTLPGPTTTTSKDAINNLGSKRQRRPSVRLGDLDDKPRPSSSSNTLVLSHGKSNTPPPPPPPPPKRPRTNLNFNNTHGDEQEEQQSPLDDGMDVWQAHNIYRRSIRSTSPTTHTNYHFDLDLDDGIRKWLIDLGLSRYAPVFQIHEVDDEVLPHLTLEDIKDMGISAVGSRRKLYAAILKLRKGLS